MFSTGRNALLIALIAGLTAGCGGSDPTPELGKVKGKVSVDGQPGADLDVVFEPQAKGTGKAEAKVGAGSIARTAADGSYELTYQGGGGLKGAVVGKHTVRVTSAAGGGPAGGEAAAKPIVLPASANTESNIVKDVTKGENTINIEITTK